MTVPPQLNFVTLACRDVERMAEFFRRSAGRRRRRRSPCTARSSSETASSSRSTARIDVASRDEVLAAHHVLRGVDGVQELEDPADSPHGFSGFSFRDPEGNLWDVVWAHASTVDARGLLTFAKPS